MDYTSLPNLHPAIVHFPIALVPLALCFDLGGLLFRKAEWLERAATSVWVLAGLTGFAALETGESAADGLSGVPAAVEPLIGTHSDWGHWAFYGLAAFALVRLVVALRDRDRERVVLRWLLLLPAAALLALVAFTADLGGQLVYDHGVAVHKTTDEPKTNGDLGKAVDSPVSQETETDELVLDAAERLQTTADGTVIWRPGPGDKAAVGTVVTAVEGTTLDAIRGAELGYGAQSGLRLEATGESWLALPGIFGDVRVEAELDLTEFEGEVGLFHHAQGTEAVGLVVQSKDGAQSLQDVRGDTANLDSAQFELPEGTFTLAVSAAGKHLKGLVDGTTVTHGHVAPGPEGRVGLLLRGQGTVRVLRLSAQPL